MVNKLFKYCLLAAVIISIIGCQEILTPSKQNNLYLNSVSKWKVDIETDAKLVRIHYKEFDKQQNLILQKDFTETGTISTQSTFSYNENRSVEEISSYTESGEIQNKFKVECEFDNHKRLLRQVVYSNDGKIKDIQTFMYDNNGNLIMKSIQTAVDGSVSNTNISNQYNNNGALVQRIFQDDKGDLSRDSISYESSKNKVTIFRFNASGLLTNSIEYNYNQIGNITYEIFTDMTIPSKTKYIYEYVYFTD